MTVVIVGISLGLGWTDMSPVVFSLFDGIRYGSRTELHQKYIRGICLEGLYGSEAVHAWLSSFSRSYYRGVVWGVWHFPYLFLFVDTTESMITYIPRMMIGVIVMAILYGEILLMTQKRMASRRSCTRWKCLH